MPPAMILYRYPPALAGLRWAPVAASGFSGARVWRGEGFALKAYPPGSMTRDRLAQIHAWQQAAGEGLPFVPRLVPALDGATFVDVDGRFWDVSTWQPGTADFHANPTRARLEAACSALAKLHQRWPSRTLGPIPGVARRLQLLAAFDGSLPAAPAELLPLFQRAREQVLRLRRFAQDALSPWVSRHFSLAPCLCDVWHDHVLFTGSEVTGVVDYGAMKVDHAAIDLARLLGSFVPGDAAAFATGLDAYRATGGTLDVPDTFVSLLADTGILCGVAGWFHRTFTNVTNLRAVADRLETLTAHLERLPDRDPFLARGVPFRIDPALQWKGR